MPDPDRIPAEVFPPADFIREEMEARGWRVEDLALKMGVDTSYVSELLAGHRVTLLAALCLGRAFGTSTEFWQNVQRAWTTRGISP